MLYRGQKVFLTGHSGFKGSWMCVLLNALGADVTGFALEPEGENNLFKLARVNAITKSYINDIRNLEALSSAMEESKPEIVIHMAAQPLVRESYAKPVETYSTNVMGTVNLLESVRRCGSVRAVVNVTSDKCYENKELERGYREDDALGGFDPYSNSKACSELVTSSYRSAFLREGGIAVATARSGNVIGGGDWAKDRLIPDCIRALMAGTSIVIRSRGAERPWQHVLEPLWGYILLADNLYKYGEDFAQGWNFGPDSGDNKNVEYIVKTVCKYWGNDDCYEIRKDCNAPHETGHLRLDNSKVKQRLDWRPQWSLDDAIAKTVEWYLTYKNGENVRTVMDRQIKRYLDGVTKVALK